MGHLGGAPERGRSDLTVGESGEVRTSDLLPREDVPLAQVLAGGGLEVV